MIYLSLFWEFLKIGLFTFGGAYGAIALIRQSVLSQGWMDEAMFANLIAISESTPGPIMVNAATYIGNTQGGALGAAVATLGVVLPSFVIILLVATILKKAIRHPTVQAVLKGIKPCLMGVILATGISMVLSCSLGSVQSPILDVRAVVILGILLGVLWLYGKKTRKEFSPIALIALSAILGMVTYGI